MAKFKLWVLIIPVIVSLACSTLTGNLNSPVSSSCVGPTPVSVNVMATAGIAPIPQIAFASNRTGNYQIYVAREDGTELSRLSYLPTENLFPNFSPQGNALLFFDTDNEKNPTVFEYKILYDGNQLIQFGNGHGWTSWAPNGRTLAFTMTGEDGNLQIATTDKGDLSQLTYSDSANLFPSWSPDGETIAFTRINQFGRGQIYLIDVDGGNPRLLRTGKTDARMPAWSPDGCKLAFVSATQTSSQIYLLDPNSSDPIQLTSSQGFNLSPVWSPDGRRIAFSSTRTGNDEIFVMDSDGKDQRNITNHESSDLYPSWNNAFNHSFIQAPSLVASDDFSSPASGWSESSTTTYSRGYINGKYHLFEAVSHKSFWAYYPGWFNDMSIEVDARMISAGDEDSGFGVVCRADNDEHFYVGEVWDNGRSGIYKSNDGQWERLAYGINEGNYDAATEEIHLRFDCIGSTLTLFVNDQFMLSAFDDEFSTGYAGLYIDTFESGGTEVHFDNFLLSLPVLGLPYPE